MMDAITTIEQALAAVGPHGTFVRIHSRIMKQAIGLLRDGDVFQKLWPIDPIELEHRYFLVDSVRALLHRLRDESH